MRKNNLFESFLVIVLLFAFFWWFKGFLDGYRDSNLSTTLLPKITMLSSSNSISPQLAKLNKYRLLLRQEDWIYLIAPSKEGYANKIEVIMVTKDESGDKVIFMNKDS